MDTVEIKPLRLSDTIRRFFYPNKITPGFLRRENIPGDEYPFETVVQCHFGWADRLRILLSGWIRVEVDTQIKPQIKDDYCVVSKSWVTPIWRG